MPRIRPASSPNDCTSGRPSKNLVTRTHCLVLAGGRLRTASSGPALAGPPTGKAATGRLTCRDEGDRSRHRCLDKPTFRPTLMNGVPRPAGDGPLLIAVAASACRGNSVVPMYRRRPVWGRPIPADASLELSRSPLGIRNSRGHPALTAELPVRAERQDAARAPNIQH
jgi:hypothetical protein